jgi:Tfp pilus assembly protein PilF
LQQGTNDPQLFFHAGMIYAKTGDSAKARSYLQRALDINPHFHILHSSTASKTLARVAQKEIVVSQQAASSVH